ncbi:response regulator [Granulosicoccus antarcticus]|uniref:Response regulator MprA n=1 Tax=Granulosicoccus antarcticus IMCC3135 TaxID=1192854 RepID=A0A2Z2NN33_9GAMM|nr:response regulator [Granulosicoccus antarcticus]ASJ71331.1 Response regulator MprA [Granulosicoccus antarcticus IMCC3135]
MKHPDDGHSAVTTADNNANVTVLLVDDSKTIRRSARSFLESEGYMVFTAVDGFEALAKVVEHRPSVVFVDIMMPRLDGYQTCALIKNNADFRNIPVIMLSSKDGLFDKARARVVGSDAHLSKPFTSRSLTDAVRWYASGSISSSKGANPAPENTVQPSETSDV